MYVQIEVWDRDLIGADDFIGQCEVDLSYLLDPAVPNSAGVIHRCQLRDQSKQHFRGLLIITVSTVSTQGRVVDVARWLANATALARAATAKEVFVRVKV